MAVYTTLAKHEIESLISHFNLPSLLTFEGSASGVENTTYFLTLDTSDQYVLTVFETLSANMLASYIQLMTSLNSHKLPVPRPCIDINGNALQSIANKPALLFPRSPGKHIDVPTPDICYAIGLMLAKIHSVGLNSPSYFPALSNPCGLSWMNESLVLAKSLLGEADIKILRDQISLYVDLQSRQLPCGIIHGDLFRDNVLTENNSITAVIDFYNAGNDVLLIDLAITANDWCYAQNGNAKKISKIDALLSGYQSHRPLSKAELNSWHACLQVAASRLWLSRLRRVALSQTSRERAPKDPSEYKLLLLRHLSPTLSAIK